MQLKYQKQGYYLVKKAISAEQLRRLCDDLACFENGIDHYGIRCLMSKVPSVRHLVYSAPLMSIAKEMLGEKAKPIRTVFFDKHPEANWNVAWHQDTLIMLKKKVDIEGFKQWHFKHGAFYVEPPVTYLRQILTVRVHLDESNPLNGGLRVIKGTHQKGRVEINRLMQIVNHSKIIACDANIGDVLLLHPLLFHSSRKALKPSHRRVIHIEYSAMPLPKPLQWYED